jgi:hypothetical protein
VTEQRSGVKVSGGTAVFLMLFLLVGSFGGMLYLISLVVG